MKTLLGIVLLAAVLIVVFGSPIAGELPLRANYFHSPEPILPMSFAHRDHVTENCIVCHHNFVDETGGDLCMNCHVAEPAIWPLLEQQFHDLCRGCHSEKAGEGVAGGPPRQCVTCHLGDYLP